MAARARLYRAFAPVGIAPREVDAMTPSQVAACLHLDELDAREGQEYVKARASQNVQHEQPDVDRTLTRAQRRAKAAAEGHGWQDDAGNVDPGTDSHGGVILA